MTDTTYNGWTSYATWRVNLEILDGYRESFMDDHIDSPAPTRSQLVDMIQEYVDDAISEYGTVESLAVEYARSFAADVDYYELANSFLDDLNERRAYAAT